MQGEPAGRGPLVRLVAVALAGCALALLTNVRVTRTLAPEELVPERGRAYFLRVWNAGASDADGVLSTLEVLEDGEVLPLPHSLHDDIRGLGSGRFSHWLDGVLLSTSDDSDPRTNGRRYALRYSLDPTLLTLVLPLLLLVDRAWWRRLLRRAAARPAATTAFLLGVALVARVIIFALEHDGTIQGSLVKGVPYSDARGWETHAAAFSEGNFEWLAASGWTARRPLYYVVLGSVYAWTGPSVAVAQLLNLLFGVITVGLTFDAVRRVAPLPVALLAALSLAVMRCGLHGQLLTMSEPLGELCTAVSVWALVMAMRPAGGSPPAPRPGWLCIAGVFLGLSNLARPLTLVAAGVLPVAFLLAPRGWLPRARVVAGGALVLGVVLAIGPWVAVQRARHGIWTISENTAEMFYAATSREDEGSWHPAISGLTPMYPLADRVRFYSEATRENLREDLGWYLGRCVRNLASGIYHAARRDLPERVTICVAFLMLAGRVPRRGRMVVAVSAALLTPQWLLWPLGALWALAGRGPMAILATYHLGTWASMTLVNVGGDHRFAHSVEWSSTVLSAWTVWRLLAVAAGTAEVPGRVIGWERGTRALRLGAAVAAAVLLGGAALAVASRPAPRPIPVVGEARARWIERALASVGQEGYRPLAARLHVQTERIRTDYRLDVVPRDPLAGGDVVTEARDYPVVVLLHCDGLNAVFPGSLPPLPDDGPLVFIGVSGLQGPVAYQQTILEVIAIGLPDGRMVYPDPALVPAHVAHISSAVR